MFAGACGEIDQVIEKNEAATIVDPGEGQRQPAGGEPDQRPKICFDSGAVDVGPLDFEECCLGSAGVLNDPAPVLLDLRIDQLPEMRPKAFVRLFLVRSH